ncbi:hypothetical protein D9M68_834050 [compost metagenome]
MLLTSTPPPTLRPPWPLRETSTGLSRLKPGVLTLAMFCPDVDRPTWDARRPL